MKISATNLLWCALVASVCHVGFAADTREFITVPRNALEVFRIFSFTKLCLCKYGCSCWRLY